MQYPQFIGFSSDLYEFLFFICYLLVLSGISDAFFTNYVQSW